jgi:hypothetical protein
MLELLNINVGKMYLDPYFTAHLKIYLRWILDLQVKAKTKTALKEHIRKHPCDFEVGKNFLDRIQ